MYRDVECRERLDLIPTQQNVRYAINRRGEPLGTSQGTRGEDFERRQVSAGSEERKLEWACRQIERLLSRVAELEGQIRELNPGLRPARPDWEEQNPCAD